MLELHRSDVYDLLDVSWTSREERRKLKVHFDAATKEVLVFDPQDEDPGRVYHRCLDAARAMELLDAGPPPASHCTERDGRRDEKPRHNLVATHSVQL